MSIQSEHRKMRPVLNVVRIKDVTQNGSQSAVYEPLSSGFNLWCTDKNRPKGWEAVELTRGAFAQPCGFVGTCWWGWGGEQDEEITHLRVTTDAYDLGDKYNLSGKDIHNRPEDIEWAKEKIESAFETANVPMPPIVIHDLKGE